MVAERPYPIDDILLAIREDRITGPTALAWLELRADEHAREVRRVRARATQQMRDRLHGADTDEFSDLFSGVYPPLGPPRGAEEYHSQPPTRRVTSWDGYIQADAPAEDSPAAEPGFEDYQTVFPPTYRRRTDPR
jgi:hypothetical protein